MDHIEMNPMDYPDAAQQVNAGVDLKKFRMDNSPAHAYPDDQPCCCPRLLFVRYVSWLELFGWWCGDKQERSLRDDKRERRRAHTLRSLDLKLAVFFQCGQQG